MRNRVALVVCFFLLSTFLYGCTKKTEDISFNHTYESAKIGDILDFGYTVYPNDATNQEVEIVVSDDSILQLTDDNTIIPIGEGKAKVSLFQDGELFDEVELNVAPILCTSIKSYDEVSVGLGRSYKLEATPEPTDCTHKEIVYCTNNAEIVSIKNNTIKGENLGDAVVTIVSVDGPTKDVLVHVFPIYEEGIAIINPYSKIMLDETKPLGIKFYPSDTTDQSVTWKSSNTSIATIDSDGYIHGKRLGTVTITAKSANGFTSSIDIEIQPVPIQSIDLSLSENSIYAGDSIRVQTVFYPENATEKTLTWESSDTSVAKVDGGKIRGVSAGKATITAYTANGLSKSVTIEIIAKPVTRSSGSGSSSSSSGGGIFNENANYMINTNTGKFHHIWCKEIKKMKDSNKWEYQGTRDEIINMGYIPCKKCNP